MKTKFNLKPIVVILLMISFCGSKNAFGMENSCNPIYAKLLNIAFYKTDSIVVVVPDNYNLNEEDKKDAESYFMYEKNFKKPVYIYKAESAINDQDKQKHLLFYGAYFHFKKYEFCQIPIKRTTNGFQIENLIFNKPDEAFYYVTKNGQRMYVCKNSKQPQISLFTKGIGKFPMHAFKGNEVVLTGSYF